jgi:hypothetical protein
MLVVQDNVTVNIDNTCNFALIEKKCAIEFTSNRSDTYVTSFAFASYDEAYKAYHAILRAYSNEKKIFTVSAMHKPAAKK